MKSFIVIGICATLFIASCTGKQEKKETNVSDSTTAIINETLPENFYKRLEGQIDGQPVVLNLQKVDGHYSGSYFKNGIPITLFIDTLVGKDSVRFSEISSAGYIQSPEEEQSFLFIKHFKNGFNTSHLSKIDAKPSHSFLTEKYPTGSFRFDSEIYKDSVKANPKNNKSPQATINFNYVKANQKTADSEWINSQIKKILELKNKDGNWDLELKKLAHKYLIDYQQEAGTETGANYNYFSSTVVNIGFNQQGYIVLNTTISDYSGGAHGNYFSELTCLDVNSQKKLSLNDVVKIDSNQLQKLVEKNFRKQFKLKSSDALNTVLFENYLKANSNFYFNDKGILFLYNPYEVASYAQGQITVFIPYTDLKGYLNTDFAERMKI